MPPQIPRCQPCIERGRHSRCDRNKPCASCTRHGTQDACYAPEDDDDKGSQQPEPDQPQQSPGPFRLDPPGSNRGTPANSSVRSSARIASPHPSHNGSDANAPNAHAGHANKEERRVKKRRLLQLLAECDSDSDSDQADGDHGLPKPPPAKKGKRPQIVPGKVAPAVQSLIPAPVIQIMKEGWREYIPLTALTDEFCRKFSYLHTSCVLQIDAKNRTFFKNSLNLPENDEYHMESPQWVQAWKRMSALIEQYTPHLADTWTQHYNNIFWHITFDAEFKIWLRYDIQVRRRSLEEDWDPAVFQQFIHKEVERQFILANRTPSRAEPSSRRRSISPPPSKSSRQTTAGASLSDQTRTARISTKPSTKSDNKCFICGGKGHIPRKCPADTLHNASAITTTEPKDVTHPIAIEAPTSAPSAETLATTPNLATFDPRAIITPLQATAWETTLRTYDILPLFHDVPAGIRSGFPLGVSSSLVSTYIPPNHRSALEAPDAVDAHIAKELSLGRYAGPFSQSTLFNLVGHFRSAPLGVVSKPSSPGEFRIIQDFSFLRNDPHISSVNSEIDADEFPCVWSFFSDAAAAVINAPPGSSGGTFDVNSAYRIIPIRTSDQRHLVISWRGALYWDRCTPFGATSSNGLFARCGDAMQQLLSKALGVVVLKWVDDFGLIRPPPDQPGGLISESDVYAFAEPLGWPWKESKTKPFSSTFTYLGLSWNLDSKSVTIPQSKHEKYAARLSAWLDAPKVTLRDTQQLIGTLVHCSSVITEGHAWLAALIRFSSSFTSTKHNSRFEKRAKPLAARDDALWWLTQLQDSPCTSALRPPPPSHPTPLFMDASTSFGFAVIVDGHWASWRLMQGWKSHNRDIGWAEMSAVELALEVAIARGIHDARLLFRSDNQGVVFAIQAGRSRNTPQNNAIKRIHARSACAGIHIDVSYIASADNPVDDPSRGIRRAALPPVDWTVPIPPHLAPFLARAPLP